MDDYSFLTPIICMISFAVIGGLIALAVYLRLKKAVMRLKDRKKLLIRCYAIYPKKNKRFSSCNIIL